jgi:hypothetical protein
MKIVSENYIELSRRNVEALLWALSNVPNDAVLSRVDSKGTLMRVRVVEDAAHYGDREAGPMPFDTERLDGAIHAPSRELLQAFNESMNREV